MKIELKTGCAKRQVGDPNICMRLRFFDQEGGYIFLDAQFVTQLSNESGKYMQPTAFIETETGVPFPLLHWLERIGMVLPKFGTRADRWFYDNRPDECNHTVNEFYEYAVSVLKEEFPEVVVDRADLRNEASES